MIQVADYGHQPEWKQFIFGFSVCVVLLIISLIRKFK